MQQNSFFNTLFNTVALKRAVLFTQMLACVCAFPNTQRSFGYWNSCKRIVCRVPCLKIRPICTGYHFRPEISSPVQRCQRANPAGRSGKAGAAHFPLSLSPLHVPLPRPPAFYQWSHSCRPGHGVRTTNKEPAMPLKMYGMSNCWFSVLASLLSRLPRGMNNTPFERRPGPGEQAEGVVAVVDVMFCGCDVFSSSCFLFIRSYFSLFSSLILCLTF